MSNKKYQSLNRLIMISIVYFILSLGILTSVIYAWFTLTNLNRTDLVSQIAGVEAEYQFYVYKDESHTGSLNPTLTDNVCTIGEDLCYEYIPNPTYSHLIDGYVAPGERFSFAIRIVSVGAAGGMLRLDLSGLVSWGFDIPENKIQRAFFYEVTKLAYINNDIESVDYKDHEPIVYYAQHFQYNHDGIYPLISDVPMGVENASNSVLIVFFDLYFDPTIYGQTIDGISHDNSNIFMNQLFIINYIFMNIYS
ncbi:MAG: hypothetical protein NUK62_01100 [Tenericutes bacterium]|nr:hypothetical protein [Mycoplasmatota bacterium]